jgi:acylpyruvate hydrolase
MLLARFSPQGQQEALDGEVRDGQAIAFTDGSTVTDRLTTGDRSPAAGDSWPLGDVTLRAPIARPRIIFCVGLNYQSHLEETRKHAPQVPVPTAPMIFMKPDSSSADPNAEISAPKVIEKLDYEGELAVVIGGGGAVAGYAVADDLSSRDLQRAETQWTRAKGFDDSCPWGPWITTADEGVDPADLHLRTLVNGEVRQDASTAELIFDIPTVVSFIAETCTLEPGDLILTGTPAGVGQSRGPQGLLSPGDVVEIEIDGLGSIKHSIGEPW